MTTQLCKFYQQGRCKYGDRCWNQHVRPQSSPGSFNQSPSPFHYYAKPEPTTYKRDQSRLSRDEVVQVLHLAREAAEQVELCKMWPLTCFSFIRMKGSLPGWIDYSMEELRFGAYAATKFDRFSQYLQDVQAVHSRAQNSRHTLLKGGRDSENLVMSYLQSDETGVAEPGPLPSVFFTSYTFDESSQQFSDPAPGLFARAAATHASANPPSQPMSSVNFGAVVSVRPAAASPPGTMPVGFSFASVPQKPQTSSPFAPVSNSQQPSFSLPSPFFQSSPKQPPNAFSHTQPVSQHQSPNTAAPFSMSSTFEKPATPVSNPAQPFNQSVTSEIYSQIPDLTSKELEQYKAATFTLNTIPVKPPPKELC